MERQAGRRPRLCAFFVYKKTIGYALRTADGYVFLYNDFAYSDGVIPVFFLNSLEK